VDAGICAPGALKIEVPDINVAVIGVPSCLFIRFGNGIALE
jgi:hypothetical protein